MEFASSSSPVKEDKSYSSMTEDLKKEDDYRQKFIIAIRLARIIGEGESCMYHAVALKFALWLQAIESDLYMIIKEKRMEYYDHYFVMAEGKWKIDAAPEKCAFFKRELLSRLIQSGEDSGGAILENGSSIEKEICGNLATPGFDIDVKPVDRKYEMEFMERFGDYIKKHPKFSEIVVAANYRLSDQEIREKWQKYYKIIEDKYSHESSSPIDKKLKKINTDLAVLKSGAIYYADKEGDYNKATMLLERALKLAEKEEDKTELNSLLAICRALNYYKAGNPRDALKQVKGVNIDDLRNYGLGKILGRLFKVLGVIYLENESLDFAIKCFEDALKYEDEEEERAILYFDLGITYFKKEEYSQAETALKEAVGINPHYGKAHCLLGDVFGIRGSWREAIAHWKKAKEWGVYSPEVAYNLIEAHIKLLEVNKAIEVFKDTLKRGVKDRDIFSLLLEGIELVEDYKRLFELIFAKRDSELNTLFLEILKTAKFNRHLAREALLQINIDTTLKEQLSNIEGLNLFQKELTIGEIADRLVDSLWFRSLNKIDNIEVVKITKELFNKGVLDTEGNLKEVPLTKLAEVVEIYVSGGMQSRLKQGKFELVKLIYCEQGKLKIPARGRLAEVEVEGVVALSKGEKGRFGALNLPSELYDRLSADNWQMLIEALQKPEAIIKEESIKQEGEDFTHFFLRLNENEVIYVSVSDWGQIIKAEGFNDYNYKLRAISIVFDIPIGESKKAISSIRKLVRSQIEDKEYRCTRLLFSKSTREILLKIDDGLGISCCKIGEIKDKEFHPLYEKRNEAQASLINEEYGFIDITPFVKPTQFVLTSASKKAKRNQRPSGSSPVRRVYEELDRKVSVFIERPLVSSPITKEKTKVFQYFDLVVI
ncbi:MAG: hypothetical protein DRP00_05950, partial [Candidatus Aenigmatarchaeota archaeon]